MLLSRRGLITGLVSLVAAPAIVRAEWLMPVKPVWTGYTGRLLEWNLIGMAGVSWNPAAEGRSWTAPKLGTLVGIYIPPRAAEQALFTLERSSDGSIQPTPGSGAMLTWRRQDGSRWLQAEGERPKRLIL